MDINQTSGFWFFYFRQGEETNKKKMNEEKKPESFSSGHVWKKKKILLSLKTDEKHLDHNVYFSVNFVYDISNMRMASHPKGLGEPQYWQNSHSWS